MSADVKAIELIYLTILAELAQRCEIDEALASGADATVASGDESRTSRRKLIDILCREGELPRMPKAVGRALQSLADQGVFRRGGTLFGWPLAQVYASYLGVTLPATLVNAPREAEVAVAFPEGASVDDLTPLLLPLRIAPERSDREQDGLGLTVLQLTIAPSGTYVGHRKSVLRPDVLAYLLEDPVKTMLLHAAGNIIRVPAAERYVVASLIDPDGGCDIDSLDWLIDAISLRRFYIDVVLAFREAVMQQPAWREYIQQSLRSLPVDVRAKIIDLCRTGEKLLGDRDPTLSFMGSDRL